MSQESILLLGPLKPALSELVHPEWMNELAQSLLLNAHQMRVMCRETIQHHPYFLQQSPTYVGLFMAQLIHHLQRNDAKGIETTINHLATVINTDHVTVSKHPDTKLDPSGSQDDHH